MAGHRAFDNDKQHHNHGHQRSNVLFLMNITIMGSGKNKIMIAVSVIIRDVTPTAATAMPTTSSDNECDRMALSRTR